ncbi:MAG: DNA-processing protein DprA [Parvularculaceae bacterium]
MSGALSHAERRDWIRLIRTENVGPVTFHRLRERFGSCAAAIDALPALSKRAGARAPARPPSVEDVEAELEAADAVGARAVCAAEPDYPTPLRAIPDHPPVLYVCGAASLFEPPAVAIVGARNASLAGRKIAERLAGGLGAAGVVVVSGLAYGIDGAAHAAAMETGTIAVVAGGIDVIYPPEHADLTRAIADRGAIVSERAPGAQPTARDFPRRNRLISGLSRGVVVVEAARRSGTLITARYALEQGREVFAVPGSPLDPRSEGANKLLREGATLVETADDVLEALAAQVRGVSDPDRDLFAWAADADGPDAERDDDALRAAARALLSHAPTHRDELLRALGEPPTSARPGAALDALIGLVLAGEAVETDGGGFALAG